MCCLFEIAVFIYGFVVLVRGQAAISRDRVVYGIPARLLGMVLMTPVPITVGIGVLIVLAVALTDPEADPEQIAHQHRGVLAAIEAGCFLIAVVIFYVVGSRYARDTSQFDAARRALDRFEGDDDDWRYRPDDGLPPPPPQRPSDAITERPPEPERKPGD